jgi:hypothetical protein
VDLSNRSLKAKARAFAWELIAELNTPPAGRVVGHAADPAVGTVRVTITPPGADGEGHHHVGLWLSPTETLIVSTLADHTMTRVELARRCGLPCDPKFKTLVTNLIERRILFEPDDESGVKNSAPPRRKSLHQ